MPNPQAVAWGAPCVRGMGGRDSQALKDGRCLGVCPQTLLSVLWCFGQGTDFLSSERPSEQTHNSDSRRSGSIWSSFSTWRMGLQGICHCLFLFLTRHNKCWKMLCLPARWHFLHHSNTQFCHLLSFFYPKYYSSGLTLSCSRDKWKAQPCCCWCLVLLCPFLGPVCSLPLAAQLPVRWLSPCCALRWHLGRFSRCSAGTRNVSLALNQVMGRRKPDKSWESQGY